MLAVSAKARFVAATALEKKSASPQFSFVARSKRRVLLVLGWYDHRLQRGIERYAQEHGWHLSPDTNCEMRTRTTPANLIQPRTDAVSNGMSFVRCTFTRTSNTVTSIGLACALGFGDGNVAYANCAFDCGAFAGWNAQDLVDNPTLRRWRRERRAIHEWN